MKRFLVLVLALGLSGCGAIPAGLFGEPVPGLTTIQLTPDSGFKGNFGKEYQELSGKFSRPDGLSGEFTAKGVEAFPGQAIQAGLQIEMMKMMQAMMGALAPLLTSGLTGGVPLPKAPAPPPSMVRN